MHRLSTGYALAAHSRCRTLRDAGEYIQALPRGKYKQPEWQIAAETLLAAERAAAR